MGDHALIRAPFVAEISTTGLSSIVEVINGASALVALLGKLDTNRLTSLRCRIVPWSVRMPSWLLTGYAGGGNQVWTVHPAC